MIFLTVLGICIILGTTACIYFLPKEEGNDGVRRLRYRPKHDRDPNRDRAQRDREQHDRDERRIGHDQGSAQQVTQERRSWRQEQQLQLQPDGHGRGGDAVWFKLTAASSPVRRHRCLSPPCREVRKIHTIVFSSCSIECALWSICVFLALCLIWRLPACLPACLLLFTFRWRILLVCVVWCVVCTEYTHLPLYVSTGVDAESHFEIAIDQFQK